jgi:hypothetical protein
MKHILLMLALCCALPLAGQTPYLERKITVSFENETPEEALKKISRVGGFVFSYNPNILEDRKTLNYQFSDRSVREILDEIFQGKIQYKTRGKYVILIKAPNETSKSEPSIVTGYVVDESTGERLKDVSIYDPVTLTSTITDSYGYFEIKINRPPSEIILAVNRENYADTVVAVPDDQRLLNIPIRVNKERLAVLADSVNQKLKRFWQRQERWINNINVRNVDDTFERTFQASFVPYVGTNGKMSAHVTNHYSLNVLGGYAYGVKKAELGGLFNLVRRDVNGVQIAGIWNGVGGGVHGVQMAGVFNTNNGPSKAAQFAGVMNLNADDSRGLAVGGVMNIAAGDVAPVQIAGVFNVAAARVDGMQLAGVFNIAGKEVRGTQIAGVFNVAPTVRGAQIGLLNIADSVRGTPIGLLSIVGKGYHKIELSADEIFYNNIAFRSGVRHFYTILHVGAKPSTYRDDFTIWTFGYGIGSSSKLTRWLYLDLDLTSNQIVHGNSIEALQLLNKVYLGLDFQVAKKFSINMGVTLNGLIIESDYDNYPSLFTDYQPNIFLDRSLGRNHDLWMWTGAKVGLRFL